MIAVPMAALVTTGARPGSRVGVVGLGLVGNLAAQAFAASGYEVVAWDPVEERRGLLPSGLRVLASPEESEDEYDLVVDCSGHDGAITQAARHVARNGELVLTGTPWAKYSEHSAHEIFHLVFHRYLHLRSGWEWQLPIQQEAFREGSVIQNFRTALRWLDDGDIQVRPLASTITPEQAQQAFEALASRTAPTLTSVIAWQ
jgi:threonine dehydrogenase-like Zn-dependent dehydrogenase